MRADIVGIFPNEASNIKLVGTVLVKAIDESQLRHHYLSIKALAEINADDSIGKNALAPPAAAPVFRSRVA